MSTSNFQDLKSVQSVILFFMQLTESCLLRHVQPVKTSSMVLVYINGSDLPVTTLVHCVVVRYLSIDSINSYRSNVPPIRMFVSCQSRLTLCLPIYWRIFDRKITMGTWKEVANNELHRDVSKHNQQTIGASTHLNLGHSWVRLKFSFPLVPWRNKDFCIWTSNLWKSYLREELDS